MKVPLSMLSGAGSSKTAAVIAILVGLYVVTKLKQQAQPSASTQPR